MHFLLKSAVAVVTVAVVAVMAVPASATTVSSMSISPGVQTVTGAVAAKWTVAWKASASTAPMFYYSYNSATAEGFKTLTAAATGSIALTHSFTACSSAKVTDTQKLVVVSQAVNSTTTVNPGPC